MSASRIRVLATAFAAVPGSTPHGPAMLAMVDALRGDLDMVTLKTEDLPHIKRMGDARMFRVPVGSAGLDQQRQIFTRAVRRQIDAEPYQIVHAFDPWSGAAAAERRDARGFRLVYEVATLPEPPARPSAPATVSRAGLAEAEIGPAEERAWLEAHRATLAAADRIVVSTNAAARAIEAQGFVGRVDVVRPGVDVGAFDVTDMPPFGLPRLLYLGPFSELRDLDALLEAIGRVARHRPVRALLAGERHRERRAALRDRVERMGLRDVIEVRGEPTPRSLVGLIGAADVCVAPAADYRLGGFAMVPQPLLEYLACGRPVVAAAVPGVSEMIRDDVEGLLYPPGDAGALADAVLEVLRDAVLRERITDAGYRRVREELSSGARRRRIRQVYELLAPDSQIHDPWEENFEEVTGLIELSTSALEALRDAEPMATDDEDGARSDTRQMPAPEPRPRRPRIAATLVDQPAATDTPASTDTQPGLVVPDTDPGRR